MVYKVSGYRGYRNREGERSATGERRRAAAPMTGNVLRRRNSKCVTVKVQLRRRFNPNSVTRPTPAKTPDDGSGTGAGEAGVKVTLSIE